LAINDGTGSLYRNGIDISNAGSVFAAGVSARRRLARRAGIRDQAHEFAKLGRQPEQATNIGGDGPPRSWGRRVERVIFDKSVTSAG
jgi:hypothetical protein